MMQVESNNESLATGKRTASGIQPGSKASDVFCRPFALWLAAGIRGHSDRKGELGQTWSGHGTGGLLYGMVSRQHQPRRPWLNLRRYRPLGVTRASRPVRVGTVGSPRSN